jgi:NAD(P)-dependent dehydrogenase (short-subunit alcohol dehydrogenase family)
MAELDGALSGRVALVTGGGRGLGEAICRTLARAGAKVVVGDVRTDLASQVVSSIDSAGGGRRRPFRST